MFHDKNMNCRLAVASIYTTKFTAQLHKQRNDWNKNICCRLFHIVERRSLTTICLNKPLTFHRKDAEENEFPGKFSFLHVVVGNSSEKLRFVERNQKNHVNCHCNAVIQRLLFLTTNPQTFASRETAANTNNTHVKWTPKVHKSRSFKGKWITKPGISIINSRKKQELGMNFIAIGFAMIIKKIKQTIETREQPENHVPKRIDLSGGQQPHKQTNSTQNL